jgi:hypothetical protein
MLCKACSEKELFVDPELNAPLYTTSSSNPELNVLMSEYFDRFGTIVLFEFNKRSISTSWTNDNLLVDYTPAISGDEQYAVTLLKRMLEDIYNHYPDEFVRRSLVYRIFLVDSLRSSPLAPNLLNVISQHSNRIIISGVSKRQNDLTPEQWSAVLFEIENSFFNKFLNIAAPAVPVQFFALRGSESTVPNPVPPVDPLGEYNEQRYRMYMAGYMKGGPHFLYFDLETNSRPSEAQDLGDYAQFLVRNTATEIKNVMTRFPIVRARVLALLPFLDSTLRLDVIGMQNTNVPNDRMPHNFFDQFR